MLELFILLSKKSCFKAAAQVSAPEPFSSMDWGWVNYSLTLFLQNKMSHRDFLMVTTSKFLFFQNFSTEAHLKRFKTIGLMLSLCARGVSQDMLYIFWFVT